MASREDSARSGVSEPAESLERDSVADLIFGITVGVAIVAAVAVTLASIINHFTFDDAILDAGREDSVNNWVTVVAALVAALACALHALLFERRRLWFGALAALFAFISFDDEVTLHERIGSAIGVEHAETVLFAPLWGGALLISWALARELPARAGRLLRLGLALLVTAIVVDLGAGFTRDLQEEGTDSPHAIRIAVEEGFEISGWIIVAGSLMTVLCLGLLGAGRRSLESTGELVSDGKLSADA